jgi:hypothetical protein
MNRLRLLLAVLLLGLLTGAVASGRDFARAGGAPPAAPARAVGVTLNAGPGGEAKAFQRFLEAGANAIEAPQPWSTLEPARGHFRLGDVAAIVRGVRSIPVMQVMVIPAAIETTGRSVPIDLRRAPWDSRQMIHRYRGLLRRLARHLGRQERYVSIANEADVYFSAHPGELPAFLRFARAEIAYLHRLAPSVEVGVTVTYDGLTGARPGIARRLAGLGDATILTYYPLAGGYRMRSPRAPLNDIPQMNRIAHGRSLVLQEVGYSSAPRLGSSPSAQASFVRNVFAASDHLPQAIPFLSFYSLFDLLARDCRGHSDQEVFLCSLGLRYRNGHPKPAWAAFRTGVQEARGST